MSVMCQEETHAPQQTISLFDHFVGAGEQSGRDFEAGSLKPFARAAIVGAACGEAATSRAA